MSEYKYIESTHLNNSFLNDDYVYWFNNIHNHKTLGY